MDVLTDALVALELTGNTITESEESNPRERKKASSRTSEGIQLQRLPNKGIEKLVGT